mgnify:CR=1 FL=1
MRTLKVIIYNRNKSSFTQLSKTEISEISSNSECENDNVPIAMRIQ